MASPFTSLQGDPSMSPSAPRTTRREFLWQTGGAAAGLGLGFAALAADRPPPSERIRIGCIGVGNQGVGNLGVHLKNTVAVCEVDRNRLAAAKDRVDKATGKPCAAYGDYRKLLDDKNVDRSEERR